MSEASEGIGLRAELLAKLHLTRRLNVDVHPFHSGADGGLDFVCTIRSKEPGFLAFGVIVWATSKELSDEAEATSFARLRLRKIVKPPYLIPVIALVYSMNDDRGFFCWIVEPSREGEKLSTISHVACKTFDVQQLDRIIERITEWYRRVQGNLIVQANEAT